MNGAQNEDINLTTAEDRLVHAMHLLGDKTRYKIFKLLLSNRDMCVGEIASELGVTASAVSQHFRSFELIGLVGKERIGQKICYVLDNEDMLVDELKNVVLKSGG